MATKRKQRQPNEDLEAAVAEILDNPIVKINLGFLNVGKAGSADVSLGGGVDTSPVGYEPRPMGVELKPVGVSLTPTDASETSQWLPTLTTFHGAIPISQNDRPDSAGSGDTTSAEDPKPMGLSGHPSEVPQGSNLRPMGLDLEPGGAGREGEAWPSKYEDDRSEGFAVPSSASLRRVDQLKPAEANAPGIDLRPSGSDVKPMGLDVGPMGSGVSQSMFLAEQLGTLFPAARVHRIRLAQDALSHVEEKVYDLLWGVKNQNRDSYRLSEFSLQRIANEGRLNIKTVRELLPRLVDKGFIGIEREADVRRNRPTQYRVWSYGEVLADQRSRNRLWFVKTGKGVFYARPVSVGVTREDSHPEEIKPMGVDLEPSGFDLEAGGVDSRPRGLAVRPMGFESKPTGVDISQGLLAELSRCIRTGLGLTPDEPLLKALVDECRQRACLTDGESASDAEILQFTEMKIRVLRHASTLRNPLAVLRRAVPECFIGQPLMEHRAAERARKGRELEELRQYEASLYDQDEESRSEDERLSLWERISGLHRTPQGYDLRAIAEDPELDEHGRTVALERMRRLGRFAPRGL